MKLKFKKENIKEEDYNFIISNVILSKTSKFTYLDIIDEITVMFEEMNPTLKSCINKAIIRLRDDGFLKVLGSNYQVIKNII